MAEGTYRREVTENPLDQSGLGNAPRARRPLMGIQTGQGSVETDNYLAQASDRLQGSLNVLRTQRQNEDIIKGELAGAAGETQDELRARGGSRHEMAGLVSVELTNSVSQWYQEMAQDARTNWAETEPEAYQEHLAQQSAALVKEIGSDPFAQRTLAGMLTDSVSRLAQAQQIGHQTFVEDGIANEYGYALEQQARTAATMMSTTAIGPNPNGNYQEFAFSVVNSIIGRESNWRPDAKNPNSTATGLGQFIESTWMETIKRHRPDLLASHSREEILAMRSDPQLGYEMTVAHTQDNAATLAAHGLDINGRNAYLLHFAGSGGGIAAIKAPRDAPVSAVLLPGQIKANDFLVGWTVGELQDWAGKKMGDLHSTTMRNNALTNPGLPPARHRKEVVNAMLRGLSAGDATLYEMAGGAGALRELGVSPGELATVEKAYKAHKDDELTAYSAAYTEESNAILDDLEEGRISGEEARERMEIMFEETPRTDEEQKRYHQTLLTHIDAAEDFDKDSHFFTPDGMVMASELMDRAREATTAEELAEAVEDLYAYGEQHGLDKETVVRQAGLLQQGFEAERKAREKKLAQAEALAEKQAAIDSAATDAITTGTLGDQPAKVQTAGLKIIKGRVSAALDKLEESGQITDADRTSVGMRLHAQNLVAANAVDTQLASQMAAAVVDIRGWSDGGEIPDSAIVAYAQFKEFADGKATEDYLNRMFKGRTDALDFFRTVQSMETGAAEFEPAMRAAAAMRENNTAIDVTAFRKSLLDPDNDTMSATITDMLWQAGRTQSGLGKWMQRYTDGVIPNHAEESERLASDPQLMQAVVEYATHMKIRNPGMSDEAAIRGAAGEAFNNGGVIMGDYFRLPQNHNVLEIAGVSEYKEIDTVVKQAIIDRFHEFEDESVRDAIIFGADDLVDQGLRLFGAGDQGDGIARPHLGQITPENFTVTATPIDGDVIIRVQPANARVDGWPAWIGGSGNYQDAKFMDNEFIQFNLSEAGTAYKDGLTEAGMPTTAMNAVADFAAATGNSLSQSQEDAARLMEAINPGVLTQELPAAADELGGAYGDGSNSDGGFVGRAISRWNDMSDRLGEKYGDGN